MRKVFGLHRLVDERHAERDIGPEFFEQLDFVGAEEAGTRRVQHEDADRIPVDAQRKCRCGTITAGEAFVAAPQREGVGTWQGKDRRMARYPIRREDPRVPWQSSETCHRRNR